MGIKGFLRGIILTVLLVAFAFVLSTCGGGRKQPTAPAPGDWTTGVSPVIPQGVGGANQPREITLSEALTELDALPVPEGVDADVFSQLKAALRDALTAKGISKLISKPPTGEANRVTDLQLIQDQEERYWLEWSYVNVGDYNQDGIVNVMDITPLAAHFNEPADESNEWIDGNADSIINIMDITPLAAGFMADCAGYRVQGQVAQGSWMEINTVSFSLAQTEAGRLHFSYDLGALAHDFYRVVPYDAYELEGVRSVIVPESVSQPPNILGLSPHGGISGESVTFNSTVEGPAPLSYAWDFGGGATPNTSSEASPTVTLGTPNTYSAALTATNAFGEDTYPFTLTVTEEATYSVSGHVGKDTGGGLQGAALTLTPGNRSATTNSSGDYTITGVPNGNYTLTPVKSGWSFDPPSWSVTVSEGDVVGNNSTASEEEGEWHIGTVDGGVAVGSHTSLAIVNGNPAISYCDETNGDLKYVRASDAQGSSWGAPVTPDSAGWVGRYTSLAVVDGNPAISYGGNGDLKYVRATDPSGSSWGTPISLDTAGGQYTSLAVVNGNPAISYYDSANRDLKFVRGNDASGSSWGTPVTPDTADIAGLFTSLAIIDGNPAISYGSTLGLTYVRANGPNGESWGSPISLDTAGGQYTSLAVVNGNPAISYYGGGGLEYVRAGDTSGESWGRPAIVDAALGRFTSLAVVNGSPAISYGFTGTLRYVRANDANGRSWGPPVVFDGDGYTSLAIVNGNPAISYYGGGGLEYVRASDTSGESWGSPQAVDVYSGWVGTHTSLAVVNANPAISYYDSANRDLKFVRGNDASRGSWGRPVTVDGAGEVGEYPPEVGEYSSLAVVNGSPAISYYDETNRDLKFVRGNDAQGNSWGSSVTVDTEGDVGEFTSLAIVNGNPAISYYDGGDTNLKYVRATDANGSSWGTSVTVDGEGAVGMYTSLAVVNGNPAISYYDETNEDLKYVRASDASGTTWRTPLTVDSAGNVGSEGTSLAVVNGNPAIGYFDTTNYDLKYVRATDADGGTWGTPRTPDSAGSVGRYASLAVINENPAISYYDYSNYDLKYVRANDANGQTWESPLTVDSHDRVGEYTSLALVNGNPAISYYKAGYSDLKFAIYY